MKFRFANGCSLSLWDSEFKELRISETSISYLTPNNSWVTVRVPDSWLTQLSKDVQQDTETSNSSPPSAKEASSSSSPRHNETSTPIRGKKSQPSSRQTPSHCSLVLSSQLDKGAQTSSQLDNEAQFTCLRKVIDDLKSGITKLDYEYVRRCTDIEDNLEYKLSDLYTRMDSIEEDNDRILTTLASSKGKLEATDKSKMALNKPTDKSERIGARQPPPGFDPNRDLALHLIQTTRPRNGLYSS